MTAIDQGRAPIHCCVCLQLGPLRRAAVILDGYAVCDTHWKTAQDSGRPVQQLLLAAYQLNRKKKGGPA